MVIATAVVGGPQVASSSRNAQKPLQAGSSSSFACVPNAAQPWGEGARSSTPSSQRCALASAGLCPSCSSSFALPQVEGLSWLDCPTWRVSRGLAHLSWSSLIWLCWPALLTWVSCLPPWSDFVGLPLRTILPLWHLNKAFYARPFGNPRRKPFGAVHHMSSEYPAEWGAVRFAMDDNTTHVCTCTGACDERHVTARARRQLAAGCCPCIMWLKNCSSNDGRAVRRVGSSN